MSKYKLGAIASGILTVVLIAPIIVMGYGLVFGASFTEQQLVSGIMLACCGVFIGIFCAFCLSELN